MTAALGTNGNNGDGKPPPTRRMSAMLKRRRARNGFYSAAGLVEAVLGLQAVPSLGQERLPGRAIACHVAREAFRIPIQDIARAAGIDRRTASSATFRLWDRRDADPEMEGRVDMMITFLRALGEKPALARRAWRALDAANPTKH